MHWPKILFGGGSGSRPLTGGGGPRPLPSFISAPERIYICYLRQFCTLPGATDHVSHVALSQHLLSMQRTLSFDAAPHHTLHCNAFGVNVTFISFISFLFDKCNKNNKITQLSIFILFSKKLLHCGYNLLENTGIFNVFINIICTLYLKKTCTPKAGRHKFIKISSPIMIFHTRHRHSIADRLSSKSLVRVEYQLQGFHGNQGPWQTHAVHYGAYLVATSPYLLPINDVIVTSS